MASLKGLDQLLYVVFAGTVIFAILFCAYLIRHDKERRKTLRDQVLQEQESSTENNL